MSIKAKSHLKFAFGVCAVICASSFSSSALALGFNIPAGGDDSIEGVLNTTITVGGAWRMYAPSVDLIGKADLNPNVCGRNANGSPYYQSCQGLFRTQSFPAERLTAAPGQFTMNADDGNLNYGKGRPVSGVAKITQDISLKYGDFGFFGKTLFFYDWVNNNFIENHPNQINKDNYLRAGSVVTEKTDPPNGRTDSIPCDPNDPRAIAAKNSGAVTCNIVYGPGLPVHNKRIDGETLRQIGTDLQFLDAYFYGKLPLPFAKELTFKVGRQAVNWGESTLLAFGSINQANPINANNFFRVGFEVADVFKPVNMVFLSTEPFESTTLEGFYQLEWQPLEAPAPGSYLSFLDVGTNNAGNKYFNLSFGGAADDPDRKGFLQDNALSGLTNTTLNALRLPDKEPKKTGQFGIALKYYAEWLNNGTELGFYFENYHSRIPMASVYSTDKSCGTNSTTTANFFGRDCPDLPVFHQPAGSPGTATSNAVPLDTLKIQLEYPENIQVYGLSFNTTAGDLSLQGEVAFRPKEPLQVAVVDLAFAGFAPTLGKCHRPTAGCQGTTTGVGTAPDGSPNMQYGSSDFVNADGSRGAYRDTFDLIVGAGVGSARSFPSFVEAYRNGTVGEYAPNSYIRGYEYLKTFQFNLGGTYVAGATDNPFGADQIITLFETGATWVPGLPSLDVLQFEAPGVQTHASAGADGSGFVFVNNPSQQPTSTNPCSATNPCMAVGGQRQACSQISDCSYGVDGLRFNPHQQDRSLYPDKLSFGYDIITLIRYESVFPGISFQPQIIWKHDVKGTAPGLATNFVEGRKFADLLFEMRYKSALSLNVGYTWIFGGGSANLYRDRDTVRTFIKYQF